MTMVWTITRISWRVRARTPKTIRLTIPATIRAAIRRPIAGRAPYVIHNMAQRQRENDYFAFKKHMTVTGTTVSTLRKCCRAYSGLGDDGRSGVGIAGFGSGCIS